MPPGVFGVPVGDQIPERIFEALEMFEITGGDDETRTRDLRRDRPDASPLKQSISTSYLYMRVIQIHFRYPIWCPVWCPLDLHRKP